MVYKRSGMRKGYRKSNYRKSYKSSGWMSTAKKALRTANFVAGLVNAEKKYVDVTTNSDISSTASIIPLSLMAQGTDQSSRNGISIKATSLTIKGAIKLAPASTLSRFRVIIFIDNECNGAAPAASDLLTAPTNIDSPYGMAQAGRFTVLHDHRYTLTDVERSLQEFNLYKKLNHHVRYANGGATSTALERGNLFMFLMSDQTANIPNWVSYSRFRYYDN